MNKQQREYLEAKARLAAAEVEEAQLEETYCKEHGYTCKRVYGIKNEAEFDRANEEVAALSEKAGIWTRICTARDEKLAAEERLIAFALSIIPAKEREILTKAAKTNWKARQQIIETVLKLDTRTVKA